MNRGLVKFMKGRLTTRNPIIVAMSARKDPKYKERDRDRERGEGERAAFGFRNYTANISHIMAKVELVICNTTHLKNYVPV